MRPFTAIAVLELFIKIWDTQRQIQRDSALRGELHQWDAPLGAM